MSPFQTKIKEQYQNDGFLVLNLISLSASGFPDLLALKDGRVVFIECKEGGDKLSPIQKYKIRLLIKFGFEAFAIHAKKGVIYPLKHKKNEKNSPLDSAIDAGF